MLGYLNGAESSAGGGLHLRLEEKHCGFGEG